jgi:hypothetical protein
MHGDLVDQVLHTCKFDAIFSIVLEVEDPKGHD